jgi:hypothetical protein
MLRPDNDPLRAFAMLPCLKVARNTTTPIFFTGLFFGSLCTGLCRGLDTTI